MRPERLVPFARAGFVARAVVYFLVGWLTFDAARTGGPPSSNRRAIVGLSDEPLGEALLLALAAGLAIYALWRFAQAIFDPQNEGTGAKGLFKRAGYVCSGVAHVAFAWIALRAAFGLPRGSSAQQWAIWLLHKPAGNIVLALFGLGLLAAAGEQFRRAWTCRFFFRLAGDVPAPHWVRWIGRMGFAARGIVFALVAWFFVRAAWFSKGTEAGGMEEAFARLREAEHGPVLLGIVAIGFCLFGLYCAVQARFERLAMRHVRR